METEEILTDTPRRLRAQQAMVDGMSDLMWIKDLKGRFLAVNRAMNLALTSYTGKPPETIVGATDHDLLPVHLADLYVSDDRRVMQGESPLRRLEKLPDANAPGGVRWVETIKTAVYEDGALIGIMGVARDVTDIQRAMEDRHHLMDELEHQHARLNDLVANVPGVVWEEALDGSYRYVNDYVEVMLGYAKDEYLARFASVTELIPEEDREMFYASSARMLAEKSGGTHAFRLIRKDGRVIWCESHCSVIVNAQGEVTGLRGVSMDVTQRVLTSEAQRQSEERFRRLADAAPVMIWTTNVEGNAQFHNRRINEFVGDLDLTGNRWLSVIHPEDIERVGSEMELAHQRHVFRPFEMRARRFDGDYRELYVAAAPQRAADGSFAGFVGTCVDLTDHRRLERHLDENKRLAGLGRLAATIAHEINNVLMAIQPYTEIIRRAPSAAMLERVSDRIASAVQRGGRITHQILRYAHSAEPSLRQVDVRSWLMTNADEWQTLLGPDVALTIDADAKLCVLADPHQMQQIFVNLATNATEAMKGNGVFRIVARATPRWPGLEQRAEGYAHFIIEDSGPGISGELATRIFEPLFTTHSAGTGLGLAIVHDVVRKHGGAISVDTDRTGARFHVVLPASKAIEAPMPGPIESWPQWAQRVLIVEDEDAVADALQMLIELNDVQVSVVHRGADALDAIDAFKPDVVILDIGLPDMPGTRVFEMIRLVHKRLPVLFATGHELEHHDAEFSGPVAHLLKPFDETSLIQALRYLASRA